MSTINPKHGTANSSVGYGKASSAVIQPAKTGFQLGQYTIPFPNAIDIRSFVHIGDSRTAQIYLTGTYKSSVHWFNAANALMGQSMKIAGNFGISAKRTDEYFNANLLSALATNAGWLVIGMPAVNDIAQAATPYVNQNGVTVNLSNVAQVAFANIAAAALMALSAGKRVIINAEPGGTSMTPAMVGQVFELNQRLREFCENTAGCHFLDLASVSWNPTNSATALAFKTGYSLDGTHYSTLGAYYQGKAFKAFIQSFVPPFEQACANVAEVSGTWSSALLLNPLFQTLTGGTISGGIALSSGSVPANMTVTGAATSSVAITSAPEPNGFGNTVTFTITGSAADTVMIQWNAPSSSLWSLTDIFQGGVTASVAAGSSNAAIMFCNQINTDKGTLEQYDMYCARGGSTTGSGPTEAYSYTLASAPSGVMAGSTSKGYLAPRLYVVLNAAGNATVTLSRAWFRKRYSLLTS